MSKKIPAWIMMDCTTSEAFCARCGGREKPTLPMSVSAFIKWNEYFSEKHKGCKEQETTA